MRRRGLAVLAGVVMLFLFAADSQAGLTRVIPNVWTTNYTNPAQQQLCVWIDVFDHENRRGPDFVKSITVNAPDGSVFSLNSSIDWLPYDRGYWKVFYASDFKGGKIVGGNYKVTVVPLAGPTISESDTIPGTFLPTPVVTSPSPNATGIGSTPSITWNPVPGATHYRVWIWNNSWNEPVYWCWDKQAHTDLTSFTVPIGELKPNCQYRFRIEPRSSAQDLEMRSRSDWFTFTTGSW
jgi:hypothetical protein